MQIRPIKTQQDHRDALRVIDTLMEAQPDTQEGDMLDVLVTLVDSYEQQHHPIETPDPIEAITFTMEQRDLKRRDLEPYIGSRARVSEILNRKRPLTLPMIRELHKGLGIPAGILIQPAQ